MYLHHGKEGVPFFSDRKRGRGPITERYDKRGADYFPSLCVENRLFLSVCEGKQNIFLIFHFFGDITWR